jgi:hypothetical protein
MARFSRAIHAFFRIARNRKDVDAPTSRGMTKKKDVDGRKKCGHDGVLEQPLRIHGYSFVCLPIRSLMRSIAALGVS